MILLGFGANLPSAAGPPIETLRAACAVMPRYGITLEKTSSFYRTAPVPVSDQPWFVNAVALAHTTLAPENMILALQEIEKEFGRVRSEKNSARTLDLDLLDYNGIVFSSPTLTLPHPRLHERAFVLYPLQEIFSCWRHPLTGRDTRTMLKVLPPEQRIEKI
jgi:2-amino-4-hydroxy-6-hydroxymethyldihydropteridine diphosphokinase